MLDLLLKVPVVTTESGLQYKDIKVGEGPSPPVGFQVCKLVLFSFFLPMHWIMTLKVAIENLTTT